MSRGGPAIGALIAGICGVATAYTTLQPAFRQQQEERDGTFSGQHENPQDQEHAISQAIVSDLREARRELENYDKGRFAWGIRNWLFGEPTKTNAPKSPEAHTGKNTPPK